LHNYANAPAQYTSNELLRLPEPFPTRRPKVIATALSQQSRGSKINSQRKWSGEMCGRKGKPLPLAEFFLSIMIIQ